MCASSDTIDGRGRIVSMCNSRAVKQCRQAVEGKTKVRAEDTKTVRAKRVEVVAALKAVGSKSRG